MRLSTIVFCLLFFSISNAQQKFDQLGISPSFTQRTKNCFRCSRTSLLATTCGFYNIQVEIDESTINLLEETITYFNQSPDVLTYLWLQLDQNIFSHESASKKYNQDAIEEKCR